MRLLSATVVSALAAHEAFRRLGFKPEEIFVALNVGRMMVSLRRGDRVFNLMAGPYPGDYAEFMDEWDAAVEGWNGSMTDVERQRIWSTSEVRARSAEIVIALALKGFTVDSPDEKPRQQATPAD